MDFIHFIISMHGGNQRDNLGNWLNEHFIRREPGDLFGSIAGEFNLVLCPQGQLPSQQPGTPPIFGRFGLACSLKVVSIFCVNQDSFCCTLPPITPPKAKMCLIKKKKSQIRYWSTTTTPATKVHFCFYKSILLFTTVS